MNDLLSILLISYNVKDYISQCIESVISQTYTDIEIICVDAQSTDGTLEIIRHYSKIDSRIKIVLSERKSYGFQVNRGISIARGRYIQIVETDDYLPLESCFYLMSNAIKYDADVVKGNFETIKEYRNGYLIKEIVDCAIGKDNAQQTLINSLDYPDLFLTDKGIWRGIYKRSFLLENKIELNETPGAAFQDIGFITRVLFAAKRMVYIEETVYCYREMRPGASTTNKNSLEYCKTEFEILLEDFPCQNGLINDATKGIILRLINSFIFEVRRLCIYNLEIKEETYNWFCRTINNALEEKRVILYENEIIDWDALIQITKGIVECKEYYRKLSTNIELNDEQDYIVFGIGKRGQYVVEYILSLGIIPLAIMDNSCAGDNMEYNKIPIYNPGLCVENYPDSVFILSSEKYADEMKSQLLALGIDEKRIVVF